MQESRSSSDSASKPQSGLKTVNPKAAGDAFDFTKCEQRAARVRRSPVVIVIGGHFKSELPQFFIELPHFFIELPQFFIQ
jgi:hypothetical protein